MEKTKRESKERITTGITIAIAVCMALLLSHIPFMIHSITALLCIGGVLELHHAATGKYGSWITALCLVMAAAAAFVPMPSFAAALSIVFPLGILLSINLMCQIGKSEKIHTEVLLCLTVLIVIFFRAIPEIRSEAQGFYLLTVAVLVGSITDIGAYAIGRRFGKHKLAAKVSPNKTLEGAAGGTLAAFVIIMSGAGICEKLGIFEVHYFLLSVYLLSASVVGQFGDLAMSAVKRLAAVKDFANFLPGHGGLLDRFDSLLFIAPFTHLFCQYVGAFFK